MRPRIKFQARPTEDEYDDDEMEEEDDVGLRARFSRRMTSNTPHSMQEEEEEEHGAAGPSTREHIYDVDSMHEKLEDIGWTSEAAWDETLMITSNDAAQVDDVDDDLARELSFYNQVWISIPVDQTGRYITQCNGSPSSL